MTLFLQENFFRLFRGISVKADFSRQRPVSFLDNSSIKKLFEELMFLTVEKRDVSLANNCGLRSKLVRKRMMYIKSNNGQRMESWERLLLHSSIKDSDCLQSIFVSDHLKNILVI